MTKIFAQTKVMRLMTLLLTAFLTSPLLVACGGGGNRTYAPPDSRYDTNYPGTQTSNTRRTTPQARQGLSTGQKVAILAGAAALYYLYNQHKNKQQQGAQGKYYLSKNGRVYYRDAQGAAHWVTPPSEGIRVPESEAQQYRDFQGYNGQSTGRDLNDLVPAQ